MIDGGATDRSKFSDMRVCFVVVALTLIRPKILSHSHTLSDTIPFTHTHTAQERQRERHKSTMVLVSRRPVVGNSRDDGTEGRDGSGEGKRRRGGDLCFTRIPALGMSEPAIFALQ